MSASTKSVSSEPVGEDQGQFVVHDRRVVGQRAVMLDRLPELTMPTLVVWGGCDYVLPVSQAHAAAARLPHGRLALLADCGHLPHVECPDRFATVLSEWLAEHSDSG